MFGQADYFWIFGLLLAGNVVVISAIDLRHLIIPNVLNGSLAALGFAFQITSQSSIPLTTIFGAIVLFSAFYLVRAAYLRSQGVVGLGLGDVKMAGASAVWLNPFNLPVFVFIACTAALLSLPLLKQFSEQYQQSRRLPFGPFLGLGLMVSWYLENTVQIDLAGY
ncbi:prepilin peptidase [Hoeflea poritis]|uniref:A24 family peptidase n=1 Tax=Hoeflea poritis TaxID=2993659 RepID=A0ABT4VVW5_9HYPH|nr:A24 family peptidase [Hoeflea poritis]MDA4848833.1 A24 family peptidase [Hoeflea poritis]